MYLLVNVETKAVWQQSFPPTESQLSDNSLLFFSAELQKNHRTGQEEPYFEIACGDSLCGWDEIPLLDVFLKHVEEKFPENLQAQKIQVGLE